MSENIEFRDGTTGPWTNKQLSKLVERVASIAYDASAQSALKDEYQGVMFAGWCCALDYIIFCLGLDVDTETEVEHGSILAEAIRQTAFLRSKGTPIQAEKLFPEDA